MSDSTPPKWAMDAAEKICGAILDQYDIDPIGIYRRGYAQAIAEAAKKEFEARPCSVAIERHTVTTVSEDRLEASPANTHTMTVWHDDGRVFRMTGDVSLTQSTD